MTELKFLTKLDCSRRPLQIENESRSNWELAASRAAAVLLELTAGGVADPARYQVVGYGQTRPLVANDTAQNRARNRRVEIVIDQAEP